MNDRNMGNKIQIFKNSDLGEIRTISIVGEPWFVAKDVCDALGLVNSRKATTTLDDDEKGVSLIVTPSREQLMTIINESGLYNLIFQSRKPEARSFRRWITHEVLPQIRKTGSYGNGNGCMSSVVEKMLDIQKQQMDIIRSLVATDSSKDLDVYNGTLDVVNLIHGVSDCTQLSESDMFTEYSGHIIKNIRNRIGISQRELSSRAHIERTHLIHIESERNKPSTSIFFKLLNAMGYIVILLDRERLKGGQNE